MAMLTYTQGFSPYHTNVTHAPALGDNKPEGKAAARRRRQMERLQRRTPPPDLLIPAAPIVEAPHLTVAAELAAMEIEQAQCEREAQFVERTLEPPRKKELTQSKLVEWFEKWRKPIKSWFRGKASIPPGDIDDLAQEVFLRLLRYSSEVVVDNPQGYLFRIAANVANEWRERSRNKKPHDPIWLDELELDPQEQPEEIYSRQVDTDVVDAAVDQLTPRQRLVLDEHVHAELTYKQIASKHGLTYRIVLRELTRAYSALRMKLPRDLVH